MTTDQTMAVQRRLLDTLIERWQETADTYNESSGHEDLDLKYGHFRTIYLRLIRDLQHVLTAGQMPCSLMTDEERGRGDCGHVHTEAVSATDSAALDDPWAKPFPLKPRPTPGAVQSLVVGHIVTLLLSPATVSARHQARELTWALRSEGVDLVEAIQRQIADLTLGNEPDVPF
ncbi:hypothetical protein [Streptomyces sp. NRRL B-24720]|uniref:hypothetical protein n=1 Tax=Streptomyces sp. NRRL B-24720 TaxID=1476876 RepID=UPI0004C69FFD|nr:hypothetical protein [Streptomyces sp. NRRL B-24720]